MEQKELQYLSVNMEHVPSSQRSFNFVRKYFNWILIW